MSDEEDIAGASVQGTGQAVNVRFIASDSRLISAIAIAVSVLCAFYSFESGRQTAQAVYWLQRNEVFLEQLSAQGVKVPADILHHKE